MRIHNKLDSLDDEERLAAWLFRIARNTVTDHFRRRSEAASEESEIPTDPLPEKENINEQVGQWLVNRIAELPAAYREAVTLSELQGVRQTEIAKRLGLSTSGAKSRVQRGRKMLKESLLQCCHFEFDRRGNVIGYQANDCSDCKEEDGKCS